MRGGSAAVPIAACAAGGILLAFLPRGGFPSWLQMVVSSFSCSGIPTGDFNPIYNVPMLGTHKAALGNPLPAPWMSRRVPPNLNLKRRGAPGSGLPGLYVLQKFR